MTNEKGIQTMFTLRYLRLLVALGALALGLLAGPLLPHRADASLGVCRGDPVVLLTNNTLVQVFATIQDDQRDVQSVTYVLHAPAGTGVKFVWYGGGYMKHLESLQFYADNPPNTYDTDTVARTGQQGVAVTSTMTVVNLSRMKGTDTAAGVSGTDLRTHVSF